MKKISWLILFTPFLLAAQSKKNAFRHDYRFTLTAQPSTYTLERKDSLQNGGSLLQIVTLDNKGNPLWVPAMIEKRGQKQQFYSDSLGIIPFRLNADSVSVSVVDLPRTPVQTAMIWIAADSKVTIKFLLGKSFWGAIGHIHSKRKMKKEEIDKIVEDLSAERIKLPVITDEYYISWEI